MLRHKLEALRRGEMVELHASATTYAFARVTPKSSVVIALNTGAQPETLQLSLSRTGLASVQKLTDRLGNAKPLTVDHGAVTLTLPAHEAVVLAP
jgi:hypothetical protein